MSSPGRTRNRAASSDDGFSLIELVIAMMVIATVLLLLMAVQTSALATITQAKQRQQATSFGNAAMEQLRALPWRSLQQGNHANFVAASGGDVNVSSTLLAPPGSPAISETLLTSASQATDIPPLSGPGGTNRFIKTDAGTGNLQFEVRSYVTRGVTSAGAVSVGDEPINLTVIVSWVPRNSSRLSTTVVRSEAFMPWGGCGDPSNTVFLGACQAVYASSATTNGVSVTISPASADPSLPAPSGGLLGSNTLSSSIQYGTASSSMSSQQTTSVSGTASQPSLGWRLNDASDAKSLGGEVSTLNAVTDIGGTSTTSSDPAPITLSGGVTSALSIAGVPAGIALTVQPGTGTSVVRSSTVKPCLGIPPAPATPSGQPCGEGAVHGAPDSGIALTVGGGTFDVFRVQNYGIDSRATRFSGLGSAPVGCAGTLGTGCAAADARRTLGLVSIGSTGSAPLVKIAGFSDLLLLDYGVGAMSNAPKRTMSGVITHPGGTCVIGTACLTPTAPIVFPETSWVSGGTTIRVRGQIQMSTGSELRMNLDPSCRTDTCSLSAESGQISVMLTYVFETGALKQALSVTSNLGSSRANVQYRAAPLG